MTLLQEHRTAPLVANPAPLHILHVVLSLDVGGLETVVLHLAHEGKIDGHEVSILCLERSGVLGDRASAMGIRRIVLGKKLRLSLRLEDEIRKVLRDLRPDIIHTHQIGALLHGGNASRHEGIPVIHTEHSNHIAMRRSWSRRLKIRLLWWYAGRYADRFCCVTKDIAVAAASTVARQKLRVVENGIPLGQLGTLEDRVQVRQTLGIPPDASVVGIVARQSEEKSIDLLINAFALLRSARADVHLLLVGDGPTKLALMKLTTDLKLDHCVHFVGYQSEPHRFLQAMDIFAMTSRMEGMPLVILEAWAAGLPVVASAVGGIPDLICDGQTGLLFPYGAPEKLAAQLHRLLDNPDLCRSLGAAGRDRVESDFSTQRMARDYQKQYLQILDREQNLV